MALIQRRAYMRKQQTRPDRTSAVMLNSAASTITHYPGMNDHAHTMQARAPDIGVAQMHL